MEATSQASTPDIALPNYGMILPNHDKAIIQPEKLKDYLLSPTHPLGRLKARFFLSIGFSADNWKDLDAEIRKMLDHEAVPKERTEYGQKYEIRGIIQGPGGRRAELVTAWIILDHEEFPRFITAYPGSSI